MKILVRAANWLGDAVITIPALREIRRAHPSAEIVILARPWVADLYGSEDFCDRLLPYEGNWSITRSIVDAAVVVWSLPNTR
jgi:heptosyltransferase-2